MSERIEDARTSYERATLDETSVAPEPYAQFGVWLEEALREPGLLEPNAMTVATVGADGRPSALELHPAAALLFFWPNLERQVRVEGSVARLGAAESDAYFARRPRGHRLSAWASPQSRVVAGRAELESEMRAAEERFAELDVTRPAYWGGFRLAAERFEFWQGRRNRVHDRIAYERSAGTWRILRLAP
jgi:pyridoxamine 5'-phosphate oxidase